MSGMDIVIKSIIHFYNGCVFGLYRGFAGGMRPNVFRMAFGRKKKQSGLGHIKENTFGSSNEISFSVLDAKKNSAEEDSDSKAGEGSPLGRISLFTLGRGKKPSSTPAKDQLITTPSMGESSASGKSGVGKLTPTGKIDTSRVNQKLDGAPTPKWEYSQQEVSQRKAKRKKAKRSAIAVGVLIALVCVGIGGYFAVRAIQHQMDFIGQLDEQISVVKSQLQELEPFVQNINDISSKPLDQLDPSSISQSYDSQKKMLQNVQSKLRSAKSDIERLQEHLVSPADKERSNQTIQSINAQLNMIEIGQQTISWYLPFGNSYIEAELFMSKLVEGDGFAREAASLANESTSQKFQESIEKSNQAISAFEEAIVAAANVREDLNLESVQVYIDYVDLRINAQRSAITADQAYLGVNSAQLISANDDYNQKETQAAEMVAGFDGRYPADLVSDAFAASRSSNSDIASWTAEYARAKDGLK